MRKLLWASVIVLLFTSAGVAQSAGQESTAEANKALVKVQADTLENQQKHMAQVMGFVGAGTNPEIDLATARTAVANARVALITAQNNYDTARAQLNLAMGVNAHTNYDVADEGLRPVDREDEAIEALARLPARRGR